MCTNSETRSESKEDNISSSNRDTYAVKNNYGVFTHDINTKTKHVKAESTLLTSMKKNYLKNYHLMLKPSQSNKISYLKL